MKIEFLNFKLENKNEKSEIEENVLGSTST